MLDRFCKILRNARSFFIVRNSRNARSFFIFKEIGNARSFFLIVGNACFFYLYFFSCIFLTMDRDQYQSEPLIPDGNNNVESSSCPIKTSVSFGFLILFNWCEGLKKPFKMFPRKALHEIKDCYVEGSIPDNFRLKKMRPLKPLPGQRMSLFAKVEASKYL